MLHDVRDLGDGRQSRNVEVFVTMQRSKVKFTQVVCVRPVGANRGMAAVLGGRSKANVTTLVVAP